MRLPWAICGNIVYFPHSPCLCPRVCSKRGKFTATAFKNSYCWYKKMESKHNYGSPFPLFLLEYGSLEFDSNEFMKVCLYLSCGRYTVAPRHSSSKLGSALGFFCIFVLTDRYTVAPRHSSNSVRLCARLSLYLTFGEYRMRLGRANRASPFALRSTFAIFVS